MEEISFSIGDDDHIGICHPSLIGTATSPKINVTTTNTKENIEMANALDGMMDLGRTTWQMGKNFVNDPKGFIGRDGLGTTAKALTPKFPTPMNVNDRPTPDENFENGDTWGSRTRDTFRPSHQPKAPKQHASNLLPGESNSYGGRFDFSA